MTTACPECGAVLGKARSLPDHRRFFGLLKVAFSNWSHSHAFQPSSEDQLRAWALIQAGHTNVATVEIPEGYASSDTTRAAFRSAVEGACRALDGPAGYHELRVTSNGLEIVTAASIAFGAVGQRDFGRIREAVEHILELALGVSADQLSRGKAA